MIMTNTAEYQEQIDQCKVIGICDVFKELGISIDDSMLMSWDEECKLVMSYCEKNNYHYYGKCKEEFFKWEGVRQAVALGKSGVVVENLS